MHSSRVSQVRVTLEFILLGTLHTPAPALVHSARAAYESVSLSRSINRTCAHRRQLTHALTRARRFEGGVDVNYTKLGAARVSVYQQPEGTIGKPLFSSPESTSDDTAQPSHPLQPPPPPPPKPAMYAVYLLVNLLFPMPQLLYPHPLPLHTMGRTASPSPSSLSSPLPKPAMHGLHGLFPLRALILL